MATTLSKTDSKEWKSYTQHLQARAHDDIIVQYTLASALKSQHSRKLSPSPNVFLWVPSIPKWVSSSYFMLGEEDTIKHGGRVISQEVVTSHVLKLEPKKSWSAKTVFGLPFQSARSLDFIGSKSKTVSNNSLAMMVPIFLKSFSP